MIRSEFNGSNDIGAYYRGGPYVPDNYDNRNIPNSGPIDFNAFYGASIVTPSQMEWDTPGDYQFTVPNYNRIKMELWGGGGAGGDPYTTGGNGGLTECYVDTFHLIAGGGGGGTSVVMVGYITQYILTGGVGGVASGGQNNLNGEKGADGAMAGQFSTCKGGDSLFGGVGGAPPNSLYCNGNDGNFPGGGGSGMSYYRIGSSGGGGAYCNSSFNYDDTVTGFPHVGSIISIHVGAGGLNITELPSWKSGNGAAGRFRLTWS
jgi:hypothetical protein